MDFKIDKVIKRDKQKLLACVIIDGDKKRKLVINEGNKKWKILPISNSDYRFLNRHVKRDPENGFDHFSNTIYNIDKYKEKDMYYLVEEEIGNIIYPIHK